MSATEPRPDDSRTEVRPEVEVRSVANPRRVRWTALDHA
jgi:hypothetical protein